MTDDLAPPPSESVRRVVTGFDHVWSVVFAPDGRAFFSERPTGRIFAFYPGQTDPVQIVEIAGLRHLAVTVPLGSRHFTAWVIAPLDDEAGIAARIGLGAAAVWGVGCLLLIVVAVAVIDRRSQQPKRRTPGRK